MPWRGAAEIDLNLLIFGRKILLGLQASKCYGMRVGQVRKRRRKEKSSKSGHQSLSTVHKKSYRNTKHVLFSHPE